MKKYFMKRAPKEMTDEENKEFLTEANIPTSKGTRQSKFSGFSAYAKDMAGRSKKDYNGPVATNGLANEIYAKQQEALHGPGGNPYLARDQARQNGSHASPDANPYAAAGSSTQGNPYASSGSNPYGSGQSDLYTGGSSRQSSNPYGSGSGSASSGGNPYASASGSGGNPYGDTGNSYNDNASHYGDGPALTKTTTSGTQAARDQLFQGIRGRSNVAASDAQSILTVDELNELPSGSFRNGPNVLAIEEEEDELLMLPSEVAPAKDQQNSHSSYGNGSAWQDYPDEHQQMAQEEDEETEAIKQQIRFTKKESVQSTRNALRTAAEAEASGRNALGMLGSQGERIANTERTLALAENQTRIAEEKSRELARLNRSIFVPHMNNPFNSNRRLQEKEARIKSEHLQEQISREKRRQLAFESERRVMDGLNGGGHGYSETALRHRQNMMKGSEERKKYQFEADSEDEDLENEIDLNLEGLDQASRRLKTLGLAMNDEVDSQNKRLDRITDQTDKLDVDVHLNAARMATLK